MKRNNRVKEAMLEGRVAYGFNLIFPSPHVVEILGMLDFDFVWLDGEHGPFTLDNELIDISVPRTVPHSGAEQLLTPVLPGSTMRIGPFNSRWAGSSQMIFLLRWKPYIPHLIGGFFLLVVVVAFVPEIIRALSGDDDPVGRSGVINLESSGLAGVGMWSSVEKNPGADAY